MGEKRRPHRARGQSEAPAPAATAAQFACRLRARLGAVKFNDLLRDLANPSRSNIRLGDKWALSPQRVGQIRAAFFVTRLELRPEVRVAVGKACEEPHEQDPVAFDRK